MSPEGLNEEQLLLIELAAQSIGLQVKRFTVRDHTIIRCVNDGSPWNPLDPNKPDFLELINAFPVFNIHHSRGRGMKVRIEIEAGFTPDVKALGARNVMIGWDFETGQSKTEIAYCVTYAAAAIARAYLRGEGQKDMPKVKVPVKEEPKEYDDGWSS